MKSQLGSSTKKIIVNESKCFLLWKSCATIGAANAANRYSSVRRILVAIRQLME